MDEPFHERGIAIEELFYFQNDQRLLERLREEMATDGCRKSLESASGIRDPAVLDALLANDITAETLISVGMIPLVATAWADQVLEDAETTAILQAADISGIKIGTVAHETLDRWLKHKPPTKLLDAWKTYIHALRTVLEPAAYSQLNILVLQRAETVAQAAGGFLGLGSKISDAERAVLDDLAAAFD